MTDYSDLIFLMGAMVMFSFLSLFANRSMMVSTMTNMHYEVEYHALSLTQEIIDEVRRTNSETELDQLITTYPENVDYKTDSQSAHSLPFNINIEKLQDNFTGANVPSFIVKVETRSPYLPGGDTGRPVNMSITKTFNN